MVSIPKQKFCEQCKNPSTKIVRGLCKQCYDKDYYQKNRKKFLERAKKFRNSPFGKEYRKKYFFWYFRSKRGKDARKKYLHTEKGKMHKRKHSRKYNSLERTKKIRRIRDRTPRGKEIKRRAENNYRQTLKGKMAQKKYFQSPKGKITKFKAYCERKKNYPIDFSFEDIEFIEQRDNMRCVYCGDEVFEYPLVPNGHPQQKTHDHLIKNGASDSSNMVLACRSCNNSKGGRDVLEWCGWKGIKIPEIVLELLAKKSG